MSVQENSTQEKFEPTPRETAIWFQIRLDGVKILLIEDGQDARLLIARILSKAGALVITSESAQEAREILARTKVEVRKA